MGSEDHRGLRRGVRKHCGLSRIVKWLPNAIECFLCRAVLKKVEAAVKTVGGLLRAGEEDTLARYHYVSGAPG